MGGFFFYLGFAIGSGLVLQQEVCHLCVAVVTGHVQRSVTHLHEEGHKHERRGGEKGRKTQLHMPTGGLFLLHHSFSKNYSSAWVERILNSCAREQFLA